MKSPLVSGAWVIVYRMPDPAQEIEFLSSIGGWFHTKAEALEAARVALTRRNGFGSPHRVAYVQVTEIDPPAAAADVEVSQ